MIHLDITVATAAFRALEKQMPAAIARGLNRGGDQVRPFVAKALRAQTNVTAMASITSRMTGSGAGANRATPAHLAYAIVARGKGIPIKEFPVADTGHGIDAKTWGVDHLFQRSFAIKGRGVGGFRARLGKSQYPIRKLYGPALPKEIVKGKAAATFRTATGTYVSAAVLAELARVLG